MAAGAKFVQRICRRYGRGLAGKECGLFWMRGMLWVCARKPASGMSKYGPFAELLFFLVKKEPTSRWKVVGSERDTEDGMSSSEEQGEHKVENFMLCSSAHHVCSPLLQEPSHEVELCSVALTSFFVGLVVPLSEVRGAFLEFVWRVVSGPLLQRSSALLLSRKGCNRMERVVMDKYRYRKDTTN